VPASKLDLACSLLPFAVMIRVPMPSCRRIGRAARPGPRPSQRHSSVCLGNLLQSCRLWQGIHHRM